MVFCDACKSARLDGPETCPRCGGVLRPLVASEVPDESVLQQVSRPCRSSPWKSQDPDPAYPLVPQPALAAVVREPSRPSPRKRRGPAVLYACRGEELTLVEWSRRSGVSYATLYTRVAKGWPIELALATPARKKRRGAGDAPQVDPRPAAVAQADARKKGVSRKLYECRGERLGLAEWSRRSGVSYGVLYARLAAGQTLEQAMSVPARPWKRRRDEYLGDPANAQAVGQEEHREEAVAVESQG